MNRRTFVAATIAVTPAVLAMESVGAMKLGALISTSRLALQTNSELPPPDFADLPWEEVMYVGMLAAWYDVFRDSLTTFFEGLALLTDNLTSDSVKAEVVEGVGVWPHLYTDVTNITPPASFTDSHQFFLDALDELDSTARPLSLGVLQGNADLLSSSIEGLDLANASLRSFVASLPYAVPDRGELGF